ncbi:MAG: ABC transporter permease subunit [Ignavibacteriales bacterium]|nr:ABC transporter permease subunit [Ignavibacteriales bacterium]
MKEKKILLQNSAALFVTLFFVYIVLFEFILPINKVLPKPSLLYESFLHIWSDYNLLFAFTTTTSVIYIAIALSILFLYAGAKYFVKLFVEMKYSIQSFQIFRFVPIIFIAVLFNFWLPNNLLAELLFGFLVAVFLAMNKLFDELKKIKEEYLLVARNLNLTPSDIYENVYWKSSLPALAKHYEQIHILLWSLILIYEFIDNTHGFGFIFRTALDYKDFTTLYTTAIILSLLIWLGNSVIRFVNNKIIYWSAE